jgi:hypothetical protein
VGNEVAQLQAATGGAGFSSSDFGADEDEAGVTKNSVSTGPTAVSTGPIAVDSYAAENINAAPAAQAGVNISATPRKLTATMSAVSTEKTSRKLTAVNVAFAHDAYKSIGAQGFTSNIGKQDATQDLVVRAGLVYTEFIIIAASGLLENDDKTHVAVKLVDQDLTATLQTCDQAVSLMSTPPFDGSFGVVQGDPEPVRVVLNPVRFLYAGRFRLCYTSNNGVSWYELSPLITVIGAETTQNRIWCTFSLINDAACDSSNPSGSAASCFCRGKIEGYQKHNITGDFVQLGLPSPALQDGLALSGASIGIPWKLRMIDATKVQGCGDPASDLQGPYFEDQFASTVENALGYEVHNFGLKITTAKNTYRICYCVGFDDDNTTLPKYNSQIITDKVIPGGKLPCREAYDFQQDAGLLTTINIKPQLASETITVIAILPFNLVIECGCDVLNCPSGSVGGCSTTPTMRYKIIPRSFDCENTGMICAADLPYYETGAGCRFLEEAVTEPADGNKILGGQVSPTNCQGPYECYDEPEQYTSTFPRFDKIKIDGSYQNNVMVKRNYDICYCDSNCNNDLNWFKAGLIEVLPPRIVVSLDQSTPENPLFVATDYYFTLKEAQTQKAGWSTGCYGLPADQGCKTNEMKLLRDPGGFVDKQMCLSEVQPDVITGHKLESGNTDFTKPSEISLNAGLATGIMYGGVTDDNNNVFPNIRILEAGWFAICYCDEDCNEMLNWAVFSRILVSGPDAGQQFTAYTDVSFNLNLTGWGLETDNHIMILSDKQSPQDCGVATQSTNVFGPAGSASLLSFQTNPVGNNPIIALNWLEDGTELVFEKSHFLKNGDYIRIKVTNNNKDPAHALQNEHTNMLGYNDKNNVHEVFYSCDSPKYPADCNENTPGDCTQLPCHKIKIPVIYTNQEFPVPSLPVEWDRTSQEEFTGILIDRASTGLGFVVCWAPKQGVAQDYVGQAGMVVVKNPALMAEARLGLTTVQPTEATDGGVAEKAGEPASEVMVMFQTSDIATYSQVDGQMSLKIGLMPGRRTTAPDPKPPGTTVWWHPMHFRDFDKKRIQSTSENDNWDDANQAFCGQWFTELWSEDVDGFPQPDGCFYNVDTTQRDPSDPDNNKDIHIITIKFTRKNHLKRNTKYYVVFNAVFNEWLTGGWPNEGAVYIWSMDDYLTNPFQVVELGKAAASPEQNTRVPPRDATGAPLLNSQGDPRFHPTEGFKITDMQATGILEIKKFCAANNPLQAAGMSPTAGTDGDECKECMTEADCGNSNPDFKWCTSPIDKNCVDGVLTKKPAFEFSMKSLAGSNILATHILRIFLHPLTAWNIGATCTTSWSEDLNGAQRCSGPGGIGACGQIQCFTEMVIGGPNNGAPDHPVNTIRLKLPNIMAPITDTTSHTIAIGNLPLPEYGFFPENIDAEIMNDKEEKPFYWNRNILATDGARLYVLPKVKFAALVTEPLDGNTQPFKGTQNNRLYIRLTMGATVFARVSASLPEIYLKLPPNIQAAARGYKCTAFNGLSEITSDLQVLGDTIPQPKGRLGGDSQDETTWRNVETPENACVMVFKEQMVLYAHSTVFFQIQLNNPQDAFKADDVDNQYEIRVNSLQFPTVVAGPYTLGSVPMDGYGKSVAVLGKLSDMILQPSNYGASQGNYLRIFFRTEQMVGSMAVPEARVMVQAPEGYDFQQYCEVSNLEPAYYIPEAERFDPCGDQAALGTCTPYLRTYGLPLHTPAKCNGKVPLGVTSQGTYSQAMISTNGRLMQASLYGFKLKIINKPLFISTDRNNWRIFTLSATETYVDGADETIRFNQKDLPGENTSWGVYPHAMPEANFKVAIEDLKPSGGGPPTNIIFYPIIVQKQSSKPIRIMAPAGYEWDFQHYDFRFKAPAAGVDESLTVEGVDADLPISGVPSKPISEPKNILTIDYMKTPWIPGLVYGFQAKIRVPVIAPARSANQFSIEFGYSGQIFEERDEAGVYEADLVKRLINGRLSYASNVAGRNTKIMFEFRTVTDIPRAGGIFIRGPKNFIFDRICQAKAEPGYPEFPHETTCLYEEQGNSSRPEISIIAGIPGIPAAHYKFSLAVINPAVATKRSTWGGALGRWEIYSFSLISEMISLDEGTTIDGYPTNAEMAENYPAKLLMYDKNHECVYNTPEQMAQLGTTSVTNCDEIDWQFGPYGARSDMPGDSTELIISFQLSERSNGRGDIVVRAPNGYIFNTECSAETHSSRIFNITGTASPSTWFQQNYAVWPSAPLAEQENCVGNDNEATITIRQGLEKTRIYVFRISVTNPMVTPEHNFFVLEYQPHDAALSGMSSEPFPGIPIWSFDDAILEPTTTAASFNAGCESIETCKPTENVVLMTLRPSNDAPTQDPVGAAITQKVVKIGMIRVEAPEGFLIRGPPTALPGSAELIECSVVITTLETNTGEKNITNYLSTFSPGQDTILAQKYTVFPEHLVKCEADVTPSSRCRILLQDRYIKKGFLYQIALTVWNPEVTTATGDPWSIRSYEDRNLDKATMLDQIALMGFPINSVVQTFLFLEPSTTNALQTVALDFNMSFPVQVEIGDTLEIVAPVTYFFGLQGDSRCPEYTYVDGSLRLTVPKCGANSIKWELQYESIPALTAVRFIVNVKNPAETPELNEFQVRHLDPSGERKSSRMIRGYTIIPELVDVSVIDFNPTAACRFDVDVVHGYPCQAAGSKSGITVIAIPTKTASLVSIQGTSNGRPFIFSEAILRRGMANEVPALYKRYEHKITAVLEVRPGSQFTLTVEGILNPTPEADDIVTLPGDALWTITSYSGPATGLDDPQNPGLFLQGYDSKATRQDEVLDHKDLAILGYIQVITNGCVVSPSYYKVMGATITVLLKPTFEWAIADVLRMTRPSGYEMIDQSVVTFLNFQISEQGLDSRRKFSMNATQNPADYYMTLAKPVLAAQTIQFTLNANLPHIPEPDMYWYFRTYKVLAQKDPDGDIIDDSQVPYPWLNREIMMYGSNDGAFAGFLLVGTIPFTVTPTMQTPGAKIVVTIVFDLPAEVQADQFLKLRVTAPSSFIFDNSCLAVGSRQFSRCAGFKNEARLTTILNRLKGIGLTVQLNVLNPGETPIPNMWRLDLFQDDNSDFVNQSPKIGYEISAMAARYVGNNQLGALSTGYFTFTPLRASPSLKVNMVFTPPPGQGYMLQCVGVETLSFDNDPGAYTCQSLGQDQPLTLTFVNASMVQGVSYTIGIGVANPAARPDSDANMWSLLLKDMDMRTFDGNQRIQGMVLKNEPVQCRSFGWSESAVESLSTVAIEWRVFQDLIPGRVKAVEVQAPLGVMFSEDTSTLQVAPVPLPLRIAKPVQVLGDILRINLDPGATIEKRIYNIRLQVSNPSSYSRENIWIFRATKDIDIEFSHVFPGYYAGDESPTKVGAVLGPSGDASHRWGSRRTHRYLSMMALLVGLATAVN